MAITLENLEIKIKGSSTDATKSVDALTSALRELSAEAKQMASYGGAANSAIRDIGRTASGSTSGMASAASGADKVTSSLEGWSEAESRLVADNKELKKQLEKIKSELDKTRAELDKLKKHTDSSSKSVKAHATGITKLLSSLGRIAFYRMIRSAIKEITQAITEGGQALIEWDREATLNVQGIKRISESVDIMKSKWKETGGAVAALGLTILQSLEPAITWILNAISTLANFIQQVIRGLRGETKWYHSVYKEAKATTGQAKELQRVLFGFDELNVLPSKNGSGGGAIGGWTNQVEDIDDSILGVTDKIRGVVDALGGWKNVLLGGLGLIALLKLLNKLLGGKNKNLGEENRQLQTDTANAYAFSNALEGAGAKALGFGSALAAIPLLDLGQQKSEILDFGKKLEGLDLNMTPTVDATSAVKAGINAAKMAQGGAALTPIQIISVLSTLGLGEQVSSTLAQIQQILSENPEQIPVTLFTDLLGQALADVLNKLQKQIGNGLTIPVTTVSTAYSPHTFTATDTSTATQTYSGLTGAKKAQSLWKQNTEELNAIHAANVKTATAAQAAQNAKNAQNKAKSLWADEKSTLAAQSGANLSSKLTKDQYNFLIENQLGDLNALKTFSDFVDLQNLGLSAADQQALMAILAVLGIGGALVGAPGFFANGGTPAQGSLFYAGENGAEVVANMGNHQSGVLNVMQMQAAMEGANEGVVGAVMAMSNAIVNAIRNKDTNVYMDGEVISRKVTRSQTNTARRFGEGMA